VEIILDAAKFIGPKTRVHFLTLGTEETIIEVKFTVTADSQEPRP
jgi:hypothetical protein